MRQPYTLLALWFPIATTFRVMRIKRIIFKVFSIVYKEFVFLLFRLIRSATRGGEDQKTSPAQKYAILYAIWYHLYNLKNGKTLLEVTLLHGRFSLFLNCTHGTKWRKVSHILLNLHGLPSFFGKTFTQGYFSSGEPPMQFKVLSGTPDYISTLTFIL